jgi:hypothetical protein
MERDIVSTAQKRFKAILHLVPQAEFTAVNDEITWLDDREQPTEEQILEVIENLDVLGKEQDVRRKRNALLASTDWTVLPDSPLAPEKKAEYLTYRQALRDVTSLTEFPDVEFPDKPN